MDILKDMKYSAKTLFYNDYEIGFFIPFGVLPICIFVGKVSGGNYLFHLKLLGISILLYILAIGILTIYRIKRRKGYDRL